MDGWTIETLRAHILGQIVDLRTMLDERYATQTKALDAAFVAQQEAMKVALDSAAQAVTKAEVATEKRFEAVNEFRGQLSDQTSTFINRAEVDVRLTAIQDKIAVVERIATHSVTQDQYGASHDSLRMMIDTERTALGDLGAALSNLRSRYAGVSVALGVIMTVLIVLVTVVQLTGK
jgi:hypothetical protein